ncbi:MAG: hypothetical protein K0U23_07390 [Gammaproteobacteria bacterium]|nr:hypothetical protein [Gammaproteobacteria bacterium]
MPKQKNTYTNHIPYIFCATALLILAANASSEFTAATDEDSIPEISKPMKWVAQLANHLCKTIVPGGTGFTDVSKSSFVIEEGKRWLCFGANSIINCVNSKMTTLSDDLSAWVSTTPKC